MSGVVPERLAGGDDSSENSSESSGYDVMDNNGEIVHMARKLTCRVNTSFISLSSAGHRRLIHLQTHAPAFFFSFNSALHFPTKIKAQWFNVWGGGGDCHFILVL